MTLGYAAVGEQQGARFAVAGVALMRGIDEPDIERLMSEAAQCSYFPPKKSRKERSNPKSLGLLCHERAHLVPVGRRAGLFRSEVVKATSTH